MDAQYFFDKGVQKLRNSDFHGAIEDFTATISFTSGFERRTVREQHQDGSTSEVNILDINEGRGNVRFNRGLAYMAIGEYTKAIEDFSKEIEYSPNDAEFYYHRATALYCLSQDIEANKDLTMANNLDPKYTRTLFLSQFPN